MPPARARQTVRYEALPGVWIPALLYEPDHVAGKVPVVLNVNGHDRPLGPRAIRHPTPRERCSARVPRLRAYAEITFTVSWGPMGQWIDDSYNSLRSLRFLLFQSESDTMHPLFAKANRLSGEVIGAAIEVHRIMGPGLLESIYERCLLRELDIRGIRALNQEQVVIDYKGTVFKEKLKFDLLVEDCLLVELKAIQDILPIHKAQLLSYMKLLNVPLGLLFNFHELKLVDGMSRLVLPGANQA